MQNDLNSVLGMFCQNGRTWRIHDVINISNIFSRLKISLWRRQLRHDWKVTRFYFQHTSGIHRPIKNSDMFTEDFSSVRFCTWRTVVHRIDGLLHRLLLGKILSQFHTYVMIMTHFPKTLLISSSCMFLSLPSGRFPRGFPHQNSSYTTWRCSNCRS
jgi:hypothetical protein